MSARNHAALRWTGAQPSGGIPRNAGMFAGQDPSKFLGLLGGLFGGRDRDGGDDGGGGSTDDQPLPTIPGFLPPNVVREPFAEGWEYPGFRSQLHDQFQTVYDMTPNTLPKSDRDDGSFSFGGLLGGLFGG